MSKIGSKVLPFEISCILLAREGLCMDIGVLDAVV